MADDVVEREVETRFTVVDLASKSITAIGSAASKASSAFNAASGTVASLVAMSGGAAAALSLHGVIETTNEHISQVKRLVTLTGMLPERADALSDALENAGVSGTDAERVLTGLSKAAFKMEQALSGEGGGGALKLIQQMGVEVRKGPEAALASMAEQAQKGRLDAVAVSHALNLPLIQSIKLTKALAKGPEEFRSGLDEAAKEAWTITGQTLADQGRIKSAAKEIGESWDHIQLIIGKEVLPVVANLMEQVKGGTGKWVTAAKEFGGFLNRNLETGITLAEKLGKVLLLNATIQKATGSGLGNWAQKIMGASIAGVPSTGIMAKLTGKVSGAMPMMATRLMLKAGERSPAAAEKMGGLLMGLSKAAPVFSAVASLARLVGIGAVIAIVVAGVESLVSNFNGVRDSLADAFLYLKIVAKPITDVFDNAFGGGSPMNTFFRTMLPAALTTVVALVATIIEYTRKAATFLEMVVSAPMDAVRNMGDTWRIASARIDKDIEVNQRLAMAVAAKAAVKNTPEDKDKAPNFNFPNARFDITQKFAEGFDPDRVAAALFNDIASAGEERIQSGLTNAFAVR